jgi:hypothetical protein
LLQSIFKSNQKKSQISQIEKKELEVKKSRKESQTPLSDGQKTEYAI